MIRFQVIPALKDIILSNAELMDVILGIKQASITKLSLAVKEFGDLEDVYLF